MVSNWEDLHQLLTQVCKNSITPSLSCHFTSPSKTIPKWQTHFLCICTPCCFSKLQTSSWFSLTEKLRYTINRHCFWPPPYRANPVWFDTQSTKKLMDSSCGLHSVRSTLKQSHSAALLWLHQEEQKVLTGQFFPPSWKNPSSCLRIGNYSVHYPSYCSHWWMK